MLNKRTQKRSALRKFCLLSAIFGALIILVCVHYRVHSQADMGSEWRIYNRTQWTIQVRDPETAQQKPIQPESFVTLERGSSGTLEVNGTSGQQVFTSQAARVTIIEPFKGQYQLQADEEVCCPDDLRNDSYDCSYCSGEDVELESSSTNID